MLKLSEGYEKASSQNLPRVDLEMLINCLAASNVSAEVRGVKAKRSTRAEYGDAAIGWVQIQRVGNQCAVKARICPEHKIREKGYEVSVIIDETEEIIEELQCHDCPASLGGCKHAYAFVAWLHRRSEEPSPTEVDCYWRKSRLSSIGTQLKAMTLVEMRKEKKTGSSVKPIERVTSRSNFFENVFNHGLQKASNCHLVEFYAQPDDVKQLSLHYLSVSYDGNRDNPERFLKYCKDSMTHLQCNTAAAATRDQSTSSTWHELRYGRITASSVYETSRCKTFDGALFERIMGAKIYDSEAIERGRLLEKKVIKILETKIGEKISSEGLLLSPTYPCFGASPDGITREHVIEVKCPSKPSTVKNYYHNDQITSRYRAQMQLQMLFSQKKKAIFCLADPQFERTNLITYYLETFDSQLSSSLMEESLRFWKKGVFTALMKSGRLVDGKI